MCFEQFTQKLCVTGFNLYAVYQVDRIETKPVRLVLTLMVGLLAAMTQAFTKVEKKGKLRSLYTTGKFLYTAGSWGATALS